MLLQRTYSSNNYYLVKTFSQHEVLGIFKVSDRDLLGSGTVRVGVIRNISAELQLKEAKVCVWYFDGITKVDFETYQAFGFTQYNTQEEIQ